MLFVFESPLTTLWRGGLGGCWALSGPTRGRSSPYSKCTYAHSALIRSRDSKVLGRGKTEKEQTSFSAPLYFLVTFFLSAQLKTARRCNSSFTTRPWHNNVPSHTSLPANTVDKYSLHLYSHVATHVAGNVMMHSLITKSSAYTNCSRIGWLGLKHTQTHSTSLNPTVWS
jgi:hypothetical protein